MVVRREEADAYAVQWRRCQQRCRRGEVVIGYKVGCTSPTTQRQMGIDHPVFGRLFASERWPSGTVLPLTRFRDLAIEGELAVRLAEDLSAENLADAAVYDAVEATFAVVELHHLAALGTQPTAVDLIESNAIHAGFVHAADSSPKLVEEPSSRRAAEPEALRIYIDGQQIAAVDDAALTTTVTNSLRWLARQLDVWGLALRAGQTVLCGSVAPLLPIAAAGRVRVEAGRFGTASCSIVSE